MYRNKVAHLTSVHSAKDVRIFGKECRTLADAGYEVVLIAPHDKPESNGGIQVDPVKTRAGRWHRMSGTVWDVYRKARRSGAEIFHFHDPELLPVGVLLKCAGKRVIYDAHEHLANDILSKYWIHPLLRRMISRLARLGEGLAAWFVDAIVGATPPILASFNRHKSVLVQNYPVAEEFSAEIPYDARGPVVLYAGSITAMKGAFEMVTAIGHVPERLSVRLILMGDVEPTEMGKILSKLAGRNKVEYRGFQPRNVMTQVAGQSRVGLVLFHPLPNYEDSQPNKLFEYMAAGLPVVASNFPSWQRIVAENRCGLLVDPLDVDEIARAITWLLDNPDEAEAMGQRGQAAVRSMYTWETQKPGLLSLYARLLQ